MASPTNSVVYPEGQEVSFRTLSVVLGLTATSVISYCFAQRAYHVDFFSRRGLSSINATKWLLLLVFVDSWAFVFLSGALVNGVGMSLSDATCSMGIFACIIFYCVSKLLTYLFLLEKVYIVWPSHAGRWGSIPYRLGFCAVLGFVVVLITMIIGRISFLTDDRRCIIGLQKASSMTTLFVDLFVNVLLTSLFLWPLWRSNLLSPNIRRVASRTLVASFAALTISAVNLTILTILHGQELGWVCLASCSTDVVVNAIVLFWLTRPGYANDEPTSHGGINGTHGPGHHARSEPSKTSKSLGGGVVQMQRISVTPGNYMGGGQLGSFNGQGQTSSFGNASSRQSTGGIRTTVDGDGVLRSPMKVNFNEYLHSGGVYDGSRPYVRDISPRHEDDDGYDKFTQLTTTNSPLSPAFPPGHLQIQPAPISRQQKRHSVGLVYESSTTDATSEAAPTTFFGKLMGRTSPAAIGRATSSASSRNGTGSVPGAMTFGGIGKGGWKRRESDENAGVRITITTKLENDDDTLTLGPSRSGSDGGREKEDSSSIMGVSRQPPS